MQYFINNNKVTKHEFTQKLNKAIETYIPYSSFYPKKEDIKIFLKENKYIEIPIYDKRYKKPVLKYFDCYIAIEKTILDIANIIEENEYDPENNDAIPIALALHKAGYRKTI